MWEKWHLFPCFIHYYLLLGIYQHNAIIMQWSNDTNSKITSTNICKYDADWRGGRETRLIDNEIKEQPEFYEPEK